MTRTNWPQRVVAGVRDSLGYARLLADSLRWSATDAERELSRRLVGYPRNHNYRLAAGRMLPSFRLHQRFRLISALYPTPLESLLDVGCCRGFFVIDAARREEPPCRACVGIDVYEPFIAVANKVKEHLQAKRAQFHLATLDDLADRPQAFGGPFQTVLLLNTYHYLFWGSQLSPKAYHDHRAILSRLAAVTSQRVILSARLEVKRLPHPLRQEAAASPNSEIYRESCFLHAAAEFFHVRQAGRIGKDALFVMSKDSGLSL